MVMDIVHVPMVRIHVPLCTVTQGWLGGQIGKPILRNQVPVFLLLNFYIGWGFSVLSQYWYLSLQNNVTVV